MGPRRDRVYTAQLKLTKDGYGVEKLTNRSQNLGYDNQPSFWSEDAMLYTSTRSERPMWSCITSTPKQEWRCATTQGSEYSPLRIPGSEAFSAIRLDTTGLQRLYRYSPTGNTLHPDLKIGYHLWIDATTSSTVLVDNRMDLYVVNTKSRIATRLQTQVGRSLHKIPSTMLVSYIHWKNKGGHQNPQPQHPNPYACVCPSPRVQDHAWLPNGHLLYGQAMHSIVQHPSLRQSFFINLRQRKSEH